MFQLYKKQSFIDTIKKLVNKKNDINLGVNFVIKLTN